MSQFAVGRDLNICKWCGQHRAAHIGRLYIDCPKQETKDMQFAPETAVPAELRNAMPVMPMLPGPMDIRAGLPVQGKKMRIVFKEGRDLNIFGLKDMNVDGQWWRIVDSEGRLYVVDPAKVNYTETK